MFTKYKIFKAFEGKEPDINDKNKLIQLLFNGIDDNNLSLVQLLVDKYNVDINCKSEFSLTPLLASIWSSSLQICRYLSNHDLININETDLLLNTPLITSVISPLKLGHIFNCIISHPNCDVNFKNDNGDNAIISAIKGRVISDEQTRLFEMIYKLLDHKNLEVDAVDSDQCNILHLACMNSDVEVVKLIIKKADVSKLVCMKNKDKKRPIQYCSNHPRIYELIKLAESMANKPIVSDKNKLIEYEF